MKSQKAQSNRLASLKTVVSGLSAVCCVLPSHAQNLFENSDNWFPQQPWPSIGGSENSNLSHYESVNLSSSCENQSECPTGGIELVFDKKSDWGQSSLQGKARQYYDDGLFHTFEEERQPQHISFSVRTSSGEVETCDFRLTTILNTEELAALALEDPDSPVDPWQPKDKHDVAFFRLGYLNYMKLNTESMVKWFGPNVWYKIDLLIHWDDQQVSIYVENVAQAIQPFYNNSKKNVNSANAVALYGLSPGGNSQFKDLQICDTLCSGGDPTILEKIGGVAQQNLIITLTLVAALNLVIF